MIKNLRYLRIAALVAALAAPACASLPLVIQVAGYTVSAMEVAIQAVQTFAHSGVVTDPAKLQKIDIDIADANAAVASFQSLVNAGADLKDKNVAAALGDFEVAWADLEGLLKDLGVMTAPLSSRAGVTQVAGRLVLPSAESLMPPGVDMAAVHARAAARKAASEQASACDDPISAVACKPDSWFSVRSPGAGRPSEPPLAARPLTDHRHLSDYLDPRPVPILLVESNWRTPVECDRGMHSVIAVFPGAVCVRDGASWPQVLEKFRGTGLAGRVTGGGPLEDSIADMAGPPAHYGMSLGSKSGAIHGYVANVYLASVLPTWLDVPVALGLGAATR